MAVVELQSSVCIKAKRSGIKELNLLAALELHFDAYIEPFHHQFHGCRELV